MLLNSWFVNAVLVESAGLKAGDRALFYLEVLLFELGVDRCVVRVVRSNAGVGRLVWLYLKAAQFDFVGRSSSAVKLPLVLVLQLSVRLSRKRKALEATSYSDNVVGGAAEF